MPEAKLAFKVGGARYEIDLDDLTALDAQDFRREVGIPLMKAFNDGAVDLDIIAGIMWLTRRKTNRRLTYRDVAGEVTYTNFEMVDDAPSPNGQGGDDNPE